MKGNLETLMSYLVMLVMIIAGTVLIFFMLAQSNPYEQLAFGNAEKLRSAMEQACSTGKPATVENFALPQGPIYILSHAASKINVNSEPNYLLYYESFPIGEAIAWETYLDKDMPQARYFAQLGNTPNLDQAKEFKKSVEEIASRQPAPQDAKARYAVIINNIVLTDLIDLRTFEPEEKGTLKPRDPLGTNTGSSFMIGGSLSHLDKTSLKYYTCEPGSLCMQTPAAIYELPLRQCGDINHVELIGQDRLTLPKEKDQSNFYFNSPCTINKIEVRVDECSCDNFAEYPIYRYDDDKKQFVSAGTRKLCADGLEHNGLAKAEKPEKCLVVDVKDKPGLGCYTFNPDVTLLQDISLGTPPTPVKDHASIMEEGGTLIYKLTTERISTAIGKEISEKLKTLAPRAVVWQWPWSGDVGLLSSIQRGLL